MAIQLVAVASLLLSSAFLLLAGGLHGLLLPTFGVAHGFTTSQLGLLGTGWAVGFVLGCLTMPRAVRRVGHVRSYGSLASVAAVTILLNLLIVDPWAWIALRAATGFCFAGAAMVVESWLNERAGRESRGRIFSIYQMVAFFSSTAGSLLLVITPPSEYFFFVIGAIFYCLAILPTALSTAASPQPLNAAKLDIRHLYSVSPVGAVVCFMIGVVNGAFGTLGPVYAQQIGLPIAAVATLMSGAMIGGSLFQFPLGWLSDRMDRRRVLLACAIGAAVVGILMVVIQPRSHLAVTGLTIVYGAMIYPMYALTVAHANDFAGPDEFVKVAGSLLILVGVGTIFGPPVAGFLMQRYVPEALFGFTAVVHVFTIAYVAYRMTRRAPPEIVLRDAFRGMPPTKTATPETAVLDPRSVDPDEAEIIPDELEPAKG